MRCLFEQAADVDAVGEFCAVGPCIDCGAFIWKGYLRGHKYRGKAEWHRVGHLHADVGYRCARCSQPFWKEAERKYLEQEQAKERIRKQELLLQEREDYTRICPFCGIRKFIGFRKREREWARHRLDRVPWPISHDVCLRSACVGKAIQSTRWETASWTPKKGKFYEYLRAEETAGIAISLGQLIWAIQHARGEDGRRPERSALP